MSVEPPPAHDSQYRDSAGQRGPHRSSGASRGEDISQVASRVEAWLTTSSTVDAPDHPEALDKQPHRWAVLDPSATRIGRSERIAGDTSEEVAEHAGPVSSPVDDAPEDDRDERLRALHAERDAATQGNSDRRRRLDAARVAQAVCNSLGLTAFERDRVLGVVCELDPGIYESRDTLQGIVLVVARRVVDAERRAWLGLDDSEWRDDQPPERLVELADRLHRLTGTDAYDCLVEECDLTPDAVDRLDATIRRELDAETFREAAVGRSPYRDPYLPPFEHRGGT
jgi:hypothetical protein